MKQECFEWDEDKEKINIEKHSIDFATAALVFDDPYVLEYPDEYHSNDENRYIAIGEVGEILFVVYTYRDEDNCDIIRLISARLATAKERRLYYD